MPVYMRLSIKHERQPLGWMNFIGCGCNSTKMSIDWKYIVVIVSCAIQLCKKHKCHAFDTVLFLSHPWTELNSKHTCLSSRFRSIETVSSRIEGRQKPIFHLAWPQPPQYRTGHVNTLCEFSCEPHQQQQHTLD